METAESYYNSSIIQTQSTIHALVEKTGFLRLQLNGYLSFIGHRVEQALREAWVDKVICGISAIQVNAGLTDDYLPELYNYRQRSYPSIS